MSPEEFRKYAHGLVEWMASYMENVEQYPVKSKVKPGEIFMQIPDAAPPEPESLIIYSKILKR
jgi:aromatic-L-amino-acid/L-tryptophan decarboxylase